MSQVARTMAVLVAAVVVSATCVRAQSPGPLTNADIIKMASSKVPEPDVIAAILDSTRSFDLSPAGVTALKAGGVSDLIITAMQLAESDEPRLRRAAMAGNEAEAIRSLGTINGAEAEYASNCNAGFGYAITLEDLAKPPSGRAVGFVGRDLATTGIVRSGYRVTLAKDAKAGVRNIGTAAATCNRSASSPGSPRSHRVREPSTTPS